MEWWGGKGAPCALSFEDFLGAFPIFLPRRRARKIRPRIGERRFCSRTTPPRPGFPAAEAVSDGSVRRRCQPLRRAERQATITQMEEQ
jgi:hypothetical protein